MDLVCFSWFDTQQIFATSFLKQTFRVLFFIKMICVNRIQTNCIHMFSRDSILSMASKELYNLRHHIKINSYLKKISNDTFIIHHCNICNW